MTIRMLSLCTMLAAGCADYFPLSAPSEHFDGVRDGYTGGDSEYIGPESDEPEGGDSGCQSILDNRCCVENDLLDCYRCRESCADTGWCEECPFGREYCLNTTGTYNDIAGNSADNVYTVTSEGLVLHYNGASWGCLPSVPGQASSVWVSNDGTVFVVGRSLSAELMDKGAAWRLDGDEWTVIAHIDNASYLFGVYGFGSDNVYFVGQVGAVLHYDGESVERMEGNFDSAGFNAVWGTSPDDLFVVGTSGWRQGVIFHFDGSEWTKALILTGRVLGVSGCSSDDVYVVTMWDEIRGEGRIHHYDGTGWTKQYSSRNGSFTDVLCLGKDNVYVMGVALYHFDGTEWRGVDTGYNTVKDVIWVSPSSEIFVAGPRVIGHYGGYIDPSMQHFRP